MASTEAAATATPTGELERLVREAADGDQRAEAEIVSRYARGVRVLVARHCRPSDPMVDDIAQDVLRTLVEQLRKGAIRDAASLPGWLQTCAIRAATAEYRHRSRHPEQPFVAEAEVEAPDPDVGAELDRTANTRRVRALVAALPVARDREVLVRFYLREQDKEQICAELGIDDEHFRRVLHRARSRLRELMNDSGIRGLSA
jgi:RNA polymerase sigma-70 factor, ECF subfamily